MLTFANSSRRTATAIVITLGCFTLPKRLGPPLDLSYGLYLYAFPVQQISAALTGDFWLALAFSICITCALALMSALFIERPAVRLKAPIPELATAVTCTTVCCNSQYERRDHHSNCGILIGAVPSEAAVDVSTLLCWVDNIRFR